METEFKNMLANISLANIYIHEGETGHRFFDKRQKDIKSSDAFIGSKERFIDKFKARTTENDNKVRVFCFQEAETWFKGFPDDTVKNRMNFTASLYDELITLNS